MGRTAPALMCLLGATVLFSDAVSQGFTVSEMAPVEPGISLRLSDPVRIEAGGEVVRVEAPGYAAPCLADVNGDGRKDLLVGQFSGGKIHVYPGLADGETGMFGARQWLEVDGEVAEVPGVW